MFFTLIDGKLAETPLFFCLFPTSRYLNPYPSEKHPAQFYQRVYGNMGVKNRTMQMHPYPAIVSAVS